MFCTIIQYPQFYMLRVYTGENVCILWHMNANRTKKTCNPGQSHRGIDSLHIHVARTYRRFILSNIGITGCFTKLKSCQGCVCRLLRAYEEKCERKNTNNLGHNVLLFLYPFLGLFARPWGFTSLPEHRKRLGGLRRDDNRETIADFQMGRGRRDDLIALTAHADDHTPGRES